ncbi:MAG: hypothetical protein HY904_05790 [Deltaproteobacteria bacterium]|nr:hypothetical protein [Deltaproteobacteria bacterium]
MTDIAAAEAAIKTGKFLFLAGDERVLSRLPRGNWIGGTIPYFMGQDGGVTARDRVFVHEAPAGTQGAKIAVYDEAHLSSIPRDAPENGFSVIIIPATSRVHVSYARNAPGYDGIFLKPIIGWIAGVHLDDLGQVHPKVFDGSTGAAHPDRAVVMHVTLPAHQQASIGMVNLFKQGQGDELAFTEEGFLVRDCLVNGTQVNFAKYLRSLGVDTRLPLVADYSGTRVNVSFQSVNDKEGTVALYAPVFTGVTYRVAEPVKDYVREFTALLPTGLATLSFSCNCILNFLYSELEGKKTGAITGPITFGEIAYQLLNQTMTYLEIHDVEPT